MKSSEAMILAAMNAILVFYIQLLWFYCWIEYFRLYNFENAMSLSCDESK